MILLQNWKAWLRNQAFDMGDVEFKNRLERFIIMASHILNFAVKKILCFSCPKCGAGVFPKTQNFKQWQLGLFRCRNRGSDLKLSNGLFIASLYGLFCGALIVSTLYWGFSSEWVRIIVVIAICWFVVWPIFCRLLGHWQIVTDLSELIHPSPKARKWSRYAGLSFWLSGAAVISVSLIWWFYLREMKHITSVLEHVDESAKSQLLDKAFGWLQVATTASFICIAFAGLFFLIGVVCHLKGKKAEPITPQDANSQK
ncbi:MAG: hypothetical protein NTW55_03645 [Planctomycetota bacterium]|nr:hypothetical protein [Planctomycetota bacterium]